MEKASLIANVHCEAFSDSEDQCRAPLELVKTHPVNTPEDGIKTTKRKPSVVARLMGLDFLPASIGTIKEDRVLQLRKQTEPQPLYRLLHHQQEQQCLLRGHLEDRSTKNFKTEILIETFSSTGSIKEHSDLQLGKQSERQPLHKLLHNQQEHQCVLRELLVDTSGKDVTTAKLNEKLPTIIKEPLDQVQQTRLTVVCPKIGSSKKCFIHECLFKLPKTITLVTTQLTRVSSQCLNYSKLCLNSKPCQSPCAENPVFQTVLSPPSKQIKCNSPIQSPKNISCKRSSMIMEAAVKILKPSTLSRHRPRSQVVARKLFNKDSESCGGAIMTVSPAKSDELTPMDSIPVHKASSSQYLRKARSSDPASGKNGVNQMKLSNKLGNSRPEVNSSLQKLGRFAVKHKMATNYEQEKEVLLSNGVGEIADRAEDLSSDHGTKKFGGKGSCSKRLQSRSTDTSRGFLLQASAKDGIFFSSPEICEQLPKSQSLKKEDPNYANGITKEHRVKRNGLNLRTILTIRDKKTKTKVEDTHLQKSKIYPSDHSELVLPMRATSQSARKFSSHDKKESSSCTRLLCPLLNESSQGTSEGYSVEDENPSLYKSQNGKKTKTSCCKWKCYSRKPKDSSGPLMKLQPGELHQQSKGSSSYLKASLPMSKREHQNVPGEQIKLQILDIHAANVRDDVEKLEVANTSSCDTSDFLAIHTNTLFSPETWNNEIDSKASEGANFIEDSYADWEYSQDIIATNLLQTFMVQKVKICPVVRNVCSETSADKSNLPVADGESCSREPEAILDSQFTTVGGFTEVYKLEPLHLIETGEAFSAGKPKSTLQNNANTFIMGATSESVSASKAPEEIGQPSPVSVLDLALHDEIPSPDNSTSCLGEPINPLVENVHGSLHPTSTTLDTSECSRRWIYGSGDDTKVGTLCKNLADDVFDNSTLVNAVAFERNDKKEHVQKLLPALRSKMGFSDCWRLDSNAPTQLVINGDTYAGYEVPGFDAQQKINGPVSNSRILSEFLYENMLFGCGDQTLDFIQSSQKLEGPLLRFRKHKANTKAPTSYGCKKSVSSKIGNFVRKDMSINFGGRGMNFRLEMVKIGLEIECALFKLLLSELLNEL